MKQAEEVVGAAVVAGVLVAPRQGTAAKLGGAIASQVGGSLGKVSTEMVLEGRGKGASPLPTGGWSYGYLAVTDDELVLAKVKQGLVGQKAVEVLARAGRDAVQGAEIGKGKLTSPLTIAFAGDETWSFDVPRAKVKDARGLLDALGVAAPA
ncbi:hypothetical protein [Conexibacter sp. SYSU D00693]|uniref:hypothetical protein n=1 Tax=Conexibacter sp. SYSU D00693 TaxID=2812560 RepID=UPI00196B569C|nr:hypothetical protein [Conexibacter sp. SYSU D00693]